MSTKEKVKAINIRYSELAETSCCLSCGGALNYADPRPGEVCVDLGSGRGQDVLRMAQSVEKEGYCYGIDVSEGMLAKARKNAEKFGIENAEFLHAELESLPLKDSTADLFISNCTINHASDKQKVWNEVFRVLKTGGRFVVSDIYSTEPVPAEYANDPEAVAECWAGAITKDEYMKVLRNAGFDEITVYEESDPYEKGKIHVSSFTFSGRKK